MQTDQSSRCRSIAPLRFGLGAVLFFALAASSAQADPLIGEDLKISRVVELSTTTTALVPGVRRSFRETAPDGSDLGVFTVPSRRVLVIKSVHVSPDLLGSGEIELTVFQRRVSPFVDKTRARWVVAQSGVAQLEFSPGLVIDGDFEVAVRNSSGSDAGVRVIAYGYLAKLK